MKNEKKTFWPYGIMLSLVAIATACVATVIISLDYPVYMDDFYLTKYQEVDKNFNEIQISQTKFEKKYKIDFLNDKVKVGEATDFLLKISSINNDNLPKFTANGIITRPHTTEFDKKFQAITENGDIKISDVVLDNQGIWQIKIRISDDKNNTAFYSFDTNATKI